MGVQQTFSLVTDLIRDLCSFWSGLEWKRFTFAPSYLNERFSVPVMIAIEEMEEQIIDSGSTEFTTPEGEVVDIAAVAPDIALSLYSGKRAKYSDLTITV